MFDVMPATVPRRRPRLLTLTLFIGALAALLAFAGPAFAETRTGEGTSPENLSLPGEGDLLKANVEYDVATGGLTASFTTRLAPGSMPEAERPTFKYTVILFNAGFPCTVEGLEAEEKLAKEGAGIELALPIYEALTFNYELPPPPPEIPPAQAYVGLWMHPRTGVIPENLTPAAKTIVGNTTTVNATLSLAAHQPFNCAAAVTQGPASETDVLLVPLTAIAEPPPAQTDSPPAQPQSAPATPPPAVGALSIAKAKKPLKLKPGKWGTTTVKVTNSGGAATGAGSLQLKGAKGVVIKVARQKLPILAPGESWTVTYKLKLTAKAKASSTLSLVGSAPGIGSAKGSIVVKLLGG